MEILVTDFSQRLCQVHLPFGASVGDLTYVLSRERGIPHTDFYVTGNGRLLAENEQLQTRGWYRMEPRLCGGKGGFGSMLRALGAQIEKTTNREACRDLSGRRLRDVNHEKEMAEWLKKQADREAEKEQRRLARLQRKLAEPKHYFNDPEYEKQCQDMSERMEDSIKKGLQASSSGTSGVSRKRPSPYGANPGKRLRLWQSGLEGLSSSEDDSGSSDEETSPSSSSSSSTSQESSFAAQAQRPTQAPSTSSSAPPPHVTTQASSTRTSPQMYPERTTELDVQVEIEPVAQKEEEEPVAQREEEVEPVVQREEEVEPVVQREEEVEPVAQREEKPLPQEAEPVVQVEAGPVIHAEVPVPVFSETQEISLSPEGHAQAQNPATPPAGDGPLDLQTVGDAAELEALGMERLKTELMSLGMKCGGTLHERAARLFSIRGLAKDQIPPALLAKPTKPKKK